MPIGIDNDSAQVPFAWMDAFTNKPTTMCSIQYEIGAVMFNIGAATAALGYNTDRSTPYGCGKAEKLYKV